MTRARDLGIALGVLEPGPRNAITDVSGVRVGHATLIAGDGPLQPGSGPVRTGVTVVVPHEEVWREPIFAGCHRLNGNGDSTGLEWLRESGTLTTPIALTNTRSLGVVRDALAAAHARERAGEGLFWSLPVTAETYDGQLSDIDGCHVRAEHVDAALAAAGEEVAEGNVGGGTGMICHGFKGGIGTASRWLDPAAGAFTVGALVQANHGRRELLTIGGARVGQHIGPEVVPVPAPPEWTADARGSVVVVIATDAPLLPNQCERLAQRAALGVGRTGAVGENWSGDIMIAFATGNRGLTPEVYGTDGERTTTITMLRNEHLTPLFEAAVEATEEAVVNALVAAETMTGRDGVTAHAIPHEALAALAGSRSRPES
jgi:D-aminopeptidase